MPYATNGGVRLCFESFGDPANTPLLLINGLGSQLINHDEEFIALLVDRGLFVTRADNRDAGLSTHFDGESSRVGEILADRREGRVPTPLYSLSDMADDSAAVLDALGVTRAHVAGWSLGGMIAQQLAIDHPERVATLTSIMSTTGDADVGQATPEANAVLMTPIPPGRDAYVERSVANNAVYGSPGLHDPARLAERARAAYDRAFDPAGVSRQFAAVVGSPSRTDQLRSLSVPTLIIHGDRDALISVSGGVRTAEAVPGARLEVIEGMGHDLVPQFFARVAGLIADHVIANA
ncbi:MAG: alpha/beta fold hydrolase [Acidimicrobiales bacterium]